MMDLKKFMKLIGLGVNMKTYEIDDIFNQFVQNALEDAIEQYAQEIPFK